MTFLGEKRKVMIFAVGVAFVLTLVKLGAAFLTHSMGILASAVDSLMDFFVSTINLFAVVKADKPPDRGHPYGHGKVEHIAGLFQCFFMSLSVIWLVGESVKRLFAGSYLQSYGIGLGVMIFSMVVSALLVVCLKIAAKKSKSIVIETEELHFSSDILAHVGVIGALYLAKVSGYIFWDLIISLVIAGYLIVWIYGIGKRAVNVLMDHEAPPEVQEKIKSFVVQFNPKITDIHDFRARAVGQQIFSEFHITIKNEKDFIRAHDLTEDLVTSLHKEFPGLEVNIHYDPEGAHEPHREELPE